MTVENNEKNNNEPKQLNDSLKKLTQELDEITNDNDKSNDEIIGVFNQDLVESFDYTNFGVIPKLLEKIDEILDNSNLGIDNNTTEQLKNIKGLLQGRYNEIIDEFRIPSETTPDKVEEKDSIVSVDFLNSLTIDDIKSIVDENFKGIREDLIKEDKNNGNKYITIKGKRFNIGEFGNDGVYNHENDNVVLLGSHSLILGNKNCYYSFDSKNDIIGVSNGDTTELKLNEGQIKISKNSNGTETWSSNGININGKLNYKEKLGRYGFYSDNNSDLFLSVIGTYESFLKITSILSNKRNNNNKCEIVSKDTLKFGDNTYEFNGSNDIRDIAKWINNYKFDD